MVRQAEVDGGEVLALMEALSNQTGATHYNNIMDIATVTEATRLLVDAQVCGPLMLACSGCHASFKYEIC